MSLRGACTSAVWAERVGLAFCHVFLCSAYMRGFPQPRRPAEHPPFPSLQIVLAFGNYMNSSKRGAAYGFRLQSLDVVRGTRRGSLAWGMGMGSSWCLWLMTGLHAAAGDEVD